MKASKIAKEPRLFKKYTVSSPIVSNFSFTGSLGNSSNRAVRYSFVSKISKAAIAVS